MSGRGLPVGGCARSRYELEIWSSGWGSSMVWEELLSSRGTWHSLMVGGAEWRGAGGGGAGGRRLEEEGGRGRPEEWTEKRRRQTWSCDMTRQISTYCRQHINSFTTLRLHWIMKHIDKWYKCSYLCDKHPLVWSTSTILLPWYYVLASETR